MLNFKKDFVEYFDKFFIRKLGSVFKKNATTQSFELYKLKKIPELKVAFPNITEDDITSLFKIFKNDAIEQNLDVFEKEKRESLKQMFPELSETTMNKIILGLLDEKDAIELRNFVDFDSKQFSEYCNLQQSSKTIDTGEDLDVSF